MNARRSFPAALARFDSLPNRRQIIDRRALAERLTTLPDAEPATLRQTATALLKDALAAGRGTIARRLAEHPSRGLEAANAQAYLVDGLLVLLADFAAARLCPGEAEPLTQIAVGGYGRGEMAPFSDVDIGFLTIGRPSPRTAQLIEMMLYALWDLGLKVGHSSRSLDDMVREAKTDVTVRTALLEARYLWGDQDIYAEAASRFRAEVQDGTARQFIADKLAERTARHQRMGDTRRRPLPSLTLGSTT